ncbi:MAG: cytochrome c biogenesis protein CcsA [Planctomycetia bacterium]
MDFASRITITCFAASYAVGMASEIARALWPVRAARWGATGFAIAGIVAQTLFLANRAVVMGRLPIGTQFDSLIVVSWLISLIYLYLLVRDRRFAMGLFILPVTLGLIVFAWTLPEQNLPDPRGGVRILGVAHGVAYLLGTGVVLIAAAAAVMYLVKTRQLKRGPFSGGLTLPSLERLDRVNTGSVYLAYCLLTLALLLGLSLRQLSLTDPKVLTSGASWLVFTVLVHRRYHPENRGRRMAVWTLAAAAVVLVSVLGDPLFGTGHMAPAGGTVPGAAP